MDEAKPLCLDNRCGVVGMIAKELARRHKEAPIGSMVQNRSRTDSANRAALLAYCETINYGLALSLAEGLRTGPSPTTEAGLDPGCTVARG